MIMKQLLFTLIGIVIFFGGCSVKSSPPVDEYTLMLEEHAISTTHSAKCSGKSIELLEPFGAYEYTTGDLHYILLPNQENSYNFSEWAQPIAAALYEKTLQAISKSGLYGSVANYNSVAKSDYILEMEINDFKQYFSPDMKHSYVVADLTFTLIDAKHFKIIAQKEFRKKIDAKTLDAKGGVQALNNAFNRIVPEIVSWLEELCR